MSLMSCNACPQTMHIQQHLVQSSSSQPSLCDNTAIVYCDAENMRPVVERGDEDSRCGRFVRQASDSHASRYPLAAVLGLAPGYVLF